MSSTKSLKFETKKIDSFFKISDRKSTIKKEIIGGVTTFLAMMYILAVNPGMLSNSSGLSGLSELPGLEKINPIGPLFLGVALSSFLGTMAIGLFANVPIGLAPGMGLNAFFTFTVASSTGFGLDYYQALVCVMLSGVLYAVIVVTPFRKKLLELLPKNFKLSLNVMIGFFMAFIGLSGLGLINSTPVVGAPTEIGGIFNPGSPLYSLYPMLIVGILSMVIGIVLHFCKVKYSFLIMVIISVIMLSMTYGILKGTNYSLLQDSGLEKAFQLKSYTDFKYFGNLYGNLFSAKTWSSTFSSPAAYVAIFTFLYFDFFDTSGTIIALGNEAKLIDEKNPKISNKWIQKVNYVDGASTIGGALLLNSSVTTFVESGAGISAGARTGFASVITASLFALSIAFYPLIGPLMPIGTSAGQLQPVTAPIVIVIGIMMMSEIKNFDWKEKIDIPILGIIILFGMLGFAISAGISWGILFYTLIYGILNVVEYCKSNEKNKETFKKIFYRHNWITLTLTFVGIVFIVLEFCIKGHLF